MAMTGVICDLDDVVRRTAASDVFVYRRGAGGTFVLTAPAVAEVREELLAVDAPAVAAALRHGVHRIVSEQPRELCAGYVGRAAAVIRVDIDVLVILGRRDGCLAGVGDDKLVAAAFAVASAPLGA